MKKTIIRFGFIVLVAVIGFSFAACANGTTEHPPLVISGTLGSGGSPNMVSVLSVIGNPRKLEVSNETKIFRAELGSNNTLSGKLKDDAITYELSGQYDPSTKVFSMQAPSSIIIFSIVGKLNSSNIIDSTSTKASVKIKSGAEWTSTDLIVTASDQTVDTEVDPETASGVTSIPAYCRGTFTDQITAQADWNLKYTVTKNSITMFDGDNPPEDITVVEVTNANGNPADENGPWHFIVQQTWDNGPEPVSAIGKYYVSKTFDDKLTSDIGSALVKDLFWGDEGLGPIGDASLSDAISVFGSGIKAFVAPYCATTNVDTDGIHPEDAYSPIFTGASATANAKDATTLKAKSGFVLALK